MLASVALVSCNETPDETQPSDADPFGDVTPSEDDDEGEGNGTNEEGETNAFVDVDGGTYYALYSFYVSTDGKKNGTATKNAGVVAYAAAVTVRAENSKWYKVSFPDANDNGKVKEGYLLKELLTNDAKKVTLKMLDTPVETEITGLGKKPDGTSYSTNIRLTPWESSKVVGYENKNVLLDILNKKYVIVDGQKVTKLGTTEDGKWIYIQFTVMGVDGTTEYKDVKGYCSADYIKGETPTTPSNPGGSGITPA